MRDLSRRRQIARASRETRPRRRWAGNPPVEEWRILEMIARDRPLSEVLEALVRSVERRADRALGAVSLLDPDGRRLRHAAAPNLPAAFREAMDGLEIGPRAGSCGTAAYIGERVVVTDIALDPLWTRYRELAARFGLRACCCSPIKSGSGKALGTFAIYRREPRAPSASDLELIERAQHLAGIALERREAQAALRKSERLLRGLAELSSDWYWEQDSEFRFTEMAGGAQTLAGVPPGSFIGKRRWDLPWSNMTESEWAEHRARLERHEPFQDLELHRLEANGELTIISVSGEPVFDAAGRFAGYRGVGRNITERRRAERALRESEERFRSLTELSSDWYWEQDRNYRFTAFSAGLQPKSGRSPAATLGKTRWELDYIGVSQAQWAAHRADLEARRPFRDLELARRAEDGALIWASLSGEPVFDAAARFQGYRGVGRDITQRKLAEAQSARFRAALDNSKDGFYIVDVESMRIIDVNDAGSRNLGYAREELLGREVSVLFADQSLEQLRADYRRLLDGDSGAEELRAQFRRRDGSRFPVEISRRVLRTPEATYLVGVARDISERERTERRVAQLLAEQETLFENALVGIAFLKDRRVVQCNQAFARMFGYERAELLGRSTRQLHESDEAYEMRGREAYPVVAGRGSFITDAPMRRKGGGLFWVNYRLSPVDRSDLGKGVVWVVQDISERKHAEQRLETHARRQELIAAFGQAALGESALDELLAQAVRTGCAIGAEAAAVFEHHPRDDKWLLRAALGLDTAAVIGEPVEICPGCPVRAAARAAAPVLGDEQHGARCERAQNACARDVRSSVSVQVLGECEAYGALAVFSRRPEAFRAEDVKYVQQLGVVLSTAVRRKQIEQRMERLAQFDTLTGLPNRSLLHDRLAQTLAQARRKRANTAVLFVDLDRFKVINDTLGHEVGDRLIAQVGERLARCVRQGDTLGRISGDEFAAVLAELARTEDAAIVAQKMLDALAAPFDLGGRETYVGASIGVAAFPHDGEDAETLLKNADMAMYRAKKSGRSRYRFFTAKMNERSMAKARLHADLRRALERGEFFLHYQPKVDLASGARCGMEALLRWEHPQRGPVPPAEFIPALEDSGLIVAVGEWVLGTVCDQLCAWREAGVEALPVAINVSARQFRQPGLGELVREQLRARGLPAELLELEIAESLLLEDPEQAVRTLNALREAGIRISLDDFGTGYSSMSYLTRLPLSALKIDRGFVHGAAAEPRSAAIVRAVIELAHSLGFTAVAEGVEQDEDAAFLRRHRCDQAQGYLFGRPAPAAEVARAQAPAAPA